MTDYDFLPLSPVDFEALAGDLLRASQQLVLERFGPGRDKGIDLRCAISGLTVVQCKHFHRSGSPKLKSALRQEVMKWQTSHSVDRYILVTSVSMNPQLKDEICEILSAGVPIEPSDVLGLEDLNSLLDQHPEVERRNFKLWINSTTVLDRFINSGLWSRTEDLLENIDERAKFFVQTDKYVEALDILRDRRVCIIAGPPGVGKSLLAEMLLLAYSREGFQIVPLSEDVSEGHQAWKTGEPQLFYYDDFLGQTSFAESLGKNEDRRLENFISRVTRHENKVFLLTTRDQVFRVAASVSDGIRRISKEVSRSTIMMDDYSTYVKGQILFNHIYFSSLSLEDRMSIITDDKCLGFIEHPNYSPRIVNEVLRRSDADVSAFYADLDKSLANPQDLWTASYNDLSIIAQRILRLMVSYPTAGAVEELIREQSGGVELGSYTQALRILEETWVRIGGNSGGKTRIEFANPSCRDFIIHQLQNDPILAEEAFRDAVTIKRILLLYGYANSEQFEPDNGSQRALLDEFNRSGLQIFERLKEYYATQYTERLDFANSYFQGLQSTITDPRPATLRSLIPVARNFSDGRSWILAEVTSITRSVGDDDGLSIRVGELLTLCRSLGAGESNEERESGLLLLDESLSLIYSLDELSVYVELINFYGVDLETHEVREVAYEILRERLEYLESDSSDPDEISTGANEISTLANAFDFNFDDETSQLIERAEDLSIEDESTPSPMNPEVSPPGLISSDRDAIRDLFQGLIE
jgi:Restriction endonuclease